MAKYALALRFDLVGLAQLADYTLQRLDALTIFNLLGACLPK